VDVRLRRINYPSDVRSAIAERIKSERFKQVARYESEGSRKAAEILSEADKQSRIVREKAEARRKTLEAEADVEAGRILNEAQSQDRAFYRFLENLKRYQQILGGANDMLLLSGRHELFRDLLSPPKPDPAPAPARP
jgi:membrane protease subunit HflC